MVGMFGCFVTFISILFCVNICGFDCCGDDKVKDVVKLESRNKREILEFLTEKKVKVASEVLSSFLDCIDKFRGIDPASLNRFYDKKQCEDEDFSSLISFLKCGVCFSTDGVDMYLSIDKDQLKINYERLNNVSLNECANLRIMMSSIPHGSYQDKINENIDMIVYSYCQNDCEPGSGEDLNVEIYRKV